MLRKCVLSEWQYLIIDTVCISRILGDFLIKFACFSCSTGKELYSQCVKADLFQNLQGHEWSKIILCTVCPNSNRYLEIWTMMCKICWTTLYFLRYVPVRRVVSECPIISHLDYPTIVLSVFSCTNLFGESICVEILWAWTPASSLHTQKRVLLSTTENWAFFYGILNQIV